MRGFFSLLYFLPCACMCIVYRHHFLSQNNGFVATLAYPIPFLSFITYPLFMLPHFPAGCLRDDDLSTIARLLPFFPPSLLLNVWYWYAIYPALKQCPIKCCCQCACDCIVDLVSPSHHVCLLLLLLFLLRRYKRRLRRTRRVTQIRIQAKEEEDKNSLSYK